VRLLLDTHHSRLAAERLRADGHDVIAAADDPVLAALPDDELAARVGVPVDVAPALRGARDLVEARELAQIVLEPAAAAVPEHARPTLEHFRELRRAADGLDEPGAQAIVAELRRRDGDLRSLRLALTGRDRGPELWTVVRALPREEALRRVDAAL
jgi:hypothetical protein